MPDKTIDDAPETPQNATPQSTSAKGGRGYLVFLGILIILVAAGAWLYATRPAIVSKVLSALSSHGSLGRPAPALSNSPQNLLSSGAVLNSVGKSPAQLVKGLFPTLGGPLASEGLSSTEACTSDPLTPAVGQEEAQSRPPHRRAEAPQEQSPSPRVIETPVIVHRVPPGEPAGSSRKEIESHRPSSSRDVTTDAKSRDDLKHRPAVVLPGERRKLAKPRPNAVHSESRREAKQASRKTGSNRHPGETDGAKTERFELPGSLMVAIKDYHGTLVKWGLMVILDDSLAMGKKTKTWNPPRETVAATLINKLPSALTSGSRMAIRDFLCPQNRKHRKCLSHVLFDWDGAPYKSLEEKLKKTEPSGRTDPCAAAAYAVKKDLSGLGQLTPRVLIVTGGWSKCRSREVLRALAQHKSKDQVAVDVIALGMPRRTVRGYAAMAKRAKGVFLKADNPAEIERVLSRYKKVLSKRAMEKIEIRGENAVFTVRPGEEITLAPGTYSAVLPLVASLKAAKRTVGDIKIRSGESTVVHVRIRKGRPIVKTAKK